MPGLAPSFLGGGRGVSRKLKSDIGLKELLFLLVSHASMRAGRNEHTEGIRKGLVDLRDL